ncbi:hypothetical protein ACFOWX_13505 [Sphingorhabdus arenilitoris]|uniref:Uncharacterized protein n=1 Tax=Sphingorhabdus arenilitoris TaxID=1490041 RepID=A0ABV8RKY6_9SPHN
MKYNQLYGAIAAIAVIIGSPAAANSTGLDANQLPMKQALEKAAEAKIAYQQRSKANPVPAPTPRAPSAQIQMPPPEAMIIMIRSSLVALSQANVTNNYTVLNQLGSENFRSANPPARLSELFAPFRTNKVDLAPVVFVTPQLSQQPQIVDGKLRLVGNFPTQPMRVDFDLQFEPTDGLWKLFGLSVNLNRAAPPAQPQFVPGSGADQPSR